MWGLPSGTLHGINTVRPRRLRVWRPPRCSGFPRLWRRCRLPLCSGVVSVVSWFAALARGGLGPDGGAAPVAAAFPVCFRGGYLGWIASSLEAVLFFFILSHWIGLLPSPPRFSRPRRHVLAFGTPMLHARLWGGPWASTASLSFSLNSFRVKFSDVSS